MTATDLLVLCAPSKFRSHTTFVNFFLTPRTYIHTHTTYTHVLARTYTHTLYAYITYMPTLYIHNTYTTHTYTHVLARHTHTHTHTLYIYIYIHIICIYIYIYIYVPLIKDNKYVTKITGSATNHKFINKHNLYTVKHHKLSSVIGDLYT